MEVVPNGRRGKSTVLEIGPVDKRLQDQLTVHPGSRNHQPRRIAFVVERMLLLPSGWRCWPRRAPFKRLPAWFF
jgi:hypothetical protein